jgi:CheY-like chemotaxis protein
MAIILVVDDEVGIRELLSEILIDEGYDVRLAEKRHGGAAYPWRAAP